MLTPQPTITIKKKLYESKGGHVTVREKKTERICPAPDQEMPSGTCSEAFSAVSYFSSGWGVKLGISGLRGAASGRAYIENKCKHVLIQR